MPTQSGPVEVGVVNGPNNEFCWCTNLSTGIRVLALVNVIIRCVLLTMYCLSEDSQSGFNYYNAEWGGKFTSLDLACIIIYFFAVLADLSLAKWSRCRSKLTTLVAILCWLLVNVIAILFQAVILFGLLFGGSRSVDLTAAQYQVMLSVLGLCLAYNLYCALVIAHWRRNICEELQLANTPFWSLVSPTDHQRRGGGSPFGQVSTEPPVASAPPPATPPPTYDEATKMPRQTSSSGATGGPENVKINIYTDEVECGGSEARRLEEEQQPPPEYRDVVKGSPTSTSQVL